MKFLTQLARWVGATCLLAGSLPQIQAAPAGTGSSLAWRRQAPASNSSSSGTGKLVFCHFMIGIVGERTTAADYDGDMQRAKSLGIDAFALNIGVDPYTDKQLELAYESAAKNDMKVFISFDFNWFHISDAATVGQKIATYGKLPAQLKVDGKVFASSFAGDGLDVKAMKAAAGVDVFWAPNFHPEQTADPSDIDGALNWMAWPNNGMNKAPSAAGNITVQDGDNAYKKWLGAKPYIAPVSAWFSTHFGPEVPYSKNWVFPSDLLWFERWTEILTMQPPMLEIVTWNDYGESHYIGPLDSMHYDDGNSKWVNDMPHDGWLDMAKPFIAAYHAGADKVDEFVKEDQIIYWYRPTLKTLDCDTTDTTMVTANNGSGNYFQGRPNGVETMEDSVFVVSLLTSKGSITVTSGDNKAVTYDAPAGAYAQTIPMGVGKQVFELQRDGKSVLSGTSLKDVSDICICGIYNYNAYVGTLPFKPFGSLDKDGLASLTAGLHVSTCSPTPTLNGNGTGEATAPATVPATATATSTRGYSNSTMTKSTGSGSGSGSGSGMPATTAPHNTGSNTTPTPTHTMTATTGGSSYGSGSGSKPTTAGPTASPSPSHSAGSGSGSAPSDGCNGGTAGDGMSGNYLGLCQFACEQGYCPPGVCKCTSNGAPTKSVQDTGTTGCPLPGLGDGYKGLCAFGCARGYCPETACQSSC
ncbi:glycosyl hydrolase family 71-domain-containing protein [Diplogelasinospora grovesii]|uniref:Glycosyl hydrolase family 71-domain-containing protein n=1 Tax=Diplogelasinospora grovesii TaxID=303347 RepID=A0AAN6S6U5_9PEZI|nr:glycosyl hydrolase family 71-domain-containing protein [Diplogelasinospora grovesii]